MIKPIRSTIENVVQYAWHADGTMEAYYRYNIFGNDMPDNISPLNAYGRKIYNDYMANRNQ